MLSGSVVVVVVAAHGAHVAVVLLGAVGGTSMNMAKWWAARFVPTSVPKESCQSLYPGVRTIK